MIKKFGLALLLGVLGTSTLISGAIPKEIEEKIRKEGMENWTKTGIAMPTRKSVAEKNGFHEHPIYKVFMESAEFARPFQVQYSERGFEEVVTAFQAIFFTGKPPREAMEEIKVPIEKYKLVGQ